MRGAFGSARTLKITDSDAIAQLDLVKAIAPQVTGRYQIVASSGNSNAQVIATTAPYQEVRNVTIASGTFFSDQQVQDNSKVAVLGSQIATDLFGDPADGGTDPIGQTIRIKSTKFTVIGVPTAKGGFGPENADNAIYVPLSTGQRLLAGQTSYLSQISVTGGRPEEHGPVADRHHRPAAAAPQDHRREFGRLSGDQPGGPRLDGDVHQPHPHLAPSGHRRHLSDRRAASGS